LAEAGDGVLAKRCQKLLADRRGGAAETTARDAWEVLQKQVSDKLAADEAKKLLAALDAWSAAHGATKFAAARKTDADKLRDRLAALALGPAAKIQKLFRGKVVRFEPRTNEIELLWDFSDPKQLEDFTVGYGEWKVEKGALVGEVAWAAERRPVRARAVFAGDAPCRLTCAATMQSDCRDLSVYLGEPSGKEAYLQWRKPDKYVGLFVQEDRARPGTTTRTAATGLSLGTACQMEMTVADGKVRGNINGQHEIAAQNFQPARIQPALHVGAGGSAAQVSYTGIRIVGTLDREWLEAEQKKPLGR
jgi:hypothetical protein